MKAKEKYELIEDKKMTAVEWLEDEINKVLLHLPIEREAIKNLIEQAKQMEKEQIVTAYKEGYDNGYDHGLYEDEPEDSFDFYYTETFKSE